MDFTAIYLDGEYAHKFYSGRRLWRAFDMLSPSLKLRPDYDNIRSYTKGLIHQYLKAAYNSSLRPDTVDYPQDLATVPVFSKARQARER